MRTRQLNIRIESEQLDKLRQKAKREGTPIHEVIRYLLASWVDGKINVRIERSIQVYEGIKDE